MIAKCLIIILLFCPIVIIGQDCNFSINGKILDEYSNEYLEFATVILEGTEHAGITDISGNFTINNICAGEYHLNISHIGCENERVYIQISGDTTLVLKLHHHSELLQEILVEGQAADRSKTGTRKTLNQEAIEANSGGTLATLTKKIAGVTLLNNGSNISKPIIHGLTGNRVAILNNGELQAGQQWGNDHAPEIDPFSANKITVVKGAEGVRYGSNALGGIILVEPGPIQKDPHLHGIAQYVFHTNGRGHTANISLQQGGGWLQWRLKGGFSKSGDHRAPKYFLRNTGQENAHASAQLIHQSKQWSHELYYSFYHTELGVLRGSHIGNTTDLMAAFEKEIPNFTEPDFSYSIIAPRQLVDHHLWKFQSKYFFGEHNFLQVSYSGQYNQRKEFDVRRGGRTKIPALSLNLLAHHFQGIYHRGYENDWHLETGFQWRYNDNENEVGTGIYPLIPNYNLYQPSVFVTAKKDTENWAFDLGGRYEYKYLGVKRYTNTVPTVYEEPNHKFSNLTFLAGLSRSFTKQFNSRLQMGWVNRTPEINELYSAGLHQGVASIEEGNIDLTAETSLKFIWTNNFSVKQKLFFETSLYYNPIENFIFLEPQPKLSLTIRGAFPLYIYNQANVNIWGFDFYNKWEINKNLNWVNKFSWVQGQNTTAKEPLINMPPMDLQSTFNYAFSSNNGLKNTAVSISGNYIFQQNRFSENQYFLDPPPGYFLLSASISTEIPIGNKSIQLSIDGSNLLNSSYRSFLNRLRYFADEEGIGGKINLRYKF